MSMPILDTLLRAYEKNFDIQRDYDFEGRHFVAYAEYHAHAEKYVLVRRAKLWEFDTHQYIFFDALTHLDEQALRERVNFMKDQALSKVQPQTNHMSSDIGLVILADTVDDAAARALARIRFRKNYLFGLRGWSDLKLVVFDCARKRLYINRAAQDMKAVLVRQLYKTELPS